MKIEINPDLRGYSINSQVGLLFIAEHHIALGYVTRAIDGVTYGIYFRSDDERRVAKKIMTAFEPKKKKKPNI